MAFIGLISNPMVRMSLAIIVSLLIIAYLAYRLKTDRHRVFKVAHSFLFIGCLANFTVLFANGCQMPSLARIYYDDSFWIPMTQTTYYNFLGDRFAGCSIGDFCLLAGLVVIIFALISRLLLMYRERTSQ